MIHELLFGRLEEKSIAKVIDMNEPGVYILKARTFGFKGLLGGTHSWIVHVDFEGNHLTAEVTDLETLKIQGALEVKAIRKPYGDRDKLVFISNREGGQLWFGAKPRCVRLGDLTKRDFNKLIINYPLAYTNFHVFNANCNTFSSWMCHCLGFKPFNIGIGAKSSTKWVKHQ